MPGTIGPWMARAAGVAGLVFAVLFTVSFATGRPLGRHELAARLGVGAPAFLRRGDGMMAP